MLPHVQCDDCPNVGTVCQLYVGHEGSHAAPTFSGTERVLLRWFTTGQVSQIPFTALTAARLAWAPGQPSLPLAATIVARTELRVVAAEPFPASTPRAGQLRIA